MLDVSADVQKVKHFGKALPGLTKRRVGEYIVIEVDVTKATFNNTSYRNLTPRERQAYDDLLYLTNVREGNPKIIYKT